MVSYFADHHFSLFFDAKMPNTCLFQHLKCEDFSLFIIINDSKLNMFWFWAGCSEISLTLTFHFTPPLTVGNYADHFSLFAGILRTKSIVKIIFSCSTARVTDHTSFSVHSPSVLILRCGLWLLFSRYFGK